VLSKKSGAKAPHSRERCIISSMLITLRAFLFARTRSAGVAFLMSLVCLAQTPAIHEDARGVLRLRVRVKSGESTKGLSRKRFFLIKGSLEQNKAIADAVDQRRLVSRDCYYRSIGASPSLINWLKEGDCESVYCREISQEAVAGPQAVPEFATAFTAGEKEFGNGELALKWLTTNLPEKLRDGFYKDQQTTLQALIKHAETVSGTPVFSVMTDRNGTAYFTDLEPGTYVLSSLLGAEIGAASISWTCEVQVKQGDLATEKPYLVSNTKDKNVKCVGLAKPLPACDAARTGEQ
jgi:hypothetical protein